MERKAFLYVLIGSVVAGFSGLFVKNIETTIGTMAFFRSLIPSLVLAIWMQHRGIVFFRGNWPKMMLASGLNAVRTYLFLVAFVYTSITQAIMMLFTWPIFVHVFSAMFLKEKVGPKQLLLLGSTVCGILLIFGHNEINLASDHFIGMCAGVLSAAIYSLTFVMYKTEIQYYHHNEIIFYQNLLGCVAFLPFYLLTRPWPGVLDYALMVSYACMMGIVIFIFFFIGLKYLTASRVSLISYVEIVSAVATGIIFFHDLLTIQIIVGGLLILGSVYALRTS